VGRRADFPPGGAAAFRRAAALMQAEDLHQEDSRLSGKS